MKPLAYPLFFALLSVLLMGRCSSGQEQQGQELPSLYQSLGSAPGAPLEMTLELDRAVLEEASGKAEREPARLGISRAGTSYFYNITVYVRGNMRKRYCGFPPLKLSFDKKELDEQGFSGPRQIKLVTHCQEGGDTWLLKEYLAYLLYNELTEQSFRAQLARIRYVDSKGAAPEMEHYAFLIEPKKDLARRLGAQALDLSAPPKGIQAEPYRRFVLFQYMIGNTDWGMHGHNVQFVQFEGESFPTPIPYDFDQSGLVGAPYALPHPMLPISSVSERLFQWRGGKPQGFDATVQEFRDKKSRLLAIIAGFEHLDSSEREAMTGYLEEFFQIIGQDVAEEQWPAALKSVFQQ